MAEELGIPKSPLNRLRDYFSDVRVEMKRVSWSNKQEVYGTTVMVVLATFLFAFYFWICDMIFSRSVSAILKRFLERG